MDVRQAAEREKASERGMEGGRINEALQTKNSSQSPVQRWVNRAVLGGSLDTC